MSSQSPVGSQLSQCEKSIWSIRESNPWPPAYKSDALPTELTYSLSFAIQYHEISNTIYILAIDVGTVCNNMPMDLKQIDTNILRAYTWRPSTAIGLCMRDTLNSYSFNQLDNYYIIIHNKITQSFILKWHTSVFISSSNKICIFSHNKTVLTYIETKKLVNITRK